MGWTRSLLCCAGAAALAGCTTMEAQISSSGQMGQSDTAYVNAAYQLVQLDDQAGKLAATRASDPRVKDTAAQIMTQADTLSPSLTAALKVQGATPPTQLPPDEAASLDKLRSLQGPAFDRAYVTAELNLHKQVMPVFKQEDAVTKDGAMRTVVETELPAVQGNLDRLQVLASEYGQSRQS